VKSFIFVASHSRNGIFRGALNDSEIIIAHVLFDFIWFLEVLLIFMQKKQTILVTSALPYANGPIHFGHIAGAYLPADVFVRYHRLRDDDVQYICGTDEYGIAVSISAEKAGVSPQEHVDHFHTVIRDIFQKFNISFDHFSRTTTERHTQLSQQFFKELFDNGHIEDKTVDQHYCDPCARFLADRFLEGVCYLCGFENARGDECLGCGAWLEALKLKNPKCKICHNPPNIRSTRHWFLKLGTFKQKLLDWIDAHPNWKPNVVQFAKNQIEKIESRPITRDLNWGIPVPLLEAKDKVLYVWFDAPIGYIDATMEWAEKIGKPEAWKHYWKNPDCKIVNFIGKDNIPFHLIVWPAMIMGQSTQYTLASDIPANEFYNLEGRQFSKSEGWTVDLDDFFSKYTTDQIRYAIAASAPETKDTDFSWKDFQKCNNSDLANVLGNLVHRVLTFVLKHWHGKSPTAHTGSLHEAWIQETILPFLNEIHRRKETIASLYDSYQLRKVSWEVIDLARLGNTFFDTHKPWVLISENKDQCSEIMLSLLNLLKELAICSWPIIPDTAQKIFAQLGFSESIQKIGWTPEAEKFDFKRAPAWTLGLPTILFKKIEDTEMEHEIQKLQTALKDKKKSDSYLPMKPPIVYDDFSKMDLRVAKILEAEKMKKSQKLMKLQVDLGFEKRQIIAGIAEHYSAEELVGKSVVIVANLEPRKLMGEISQGMVLAGSQPGKLRILECSEIAPGTQVS
jgi:methionyl-tRNA synthetase